MKAIDGTTINTWLISNGLIAPNGSISLLSSSVVRSYSIPSDSAKKTVLSRIVASLFDSEHDSLLWINEYGIWPSCEDWTLFDGFRASLGESSSLPEKPAYLFSNQDLPSVSSLLALILYFAWGALVISPNKRLTVRISHDEVLDVFYEDNNTFPEKIARQIELVVQTRNAGGHRDYK
jgi:hypothetical protein